MRFPQIHPFGAADPPLTNEELLALKKACAPVTALGFPSPAIIQSLRRYGYVEIVLEGLQVTPEGLARLSRERRGSQKQ